MSSFMKLIIFIIIVVICVFISKCSTPPTPQEQISSIKYINSVLETISNEKEQLIERVQLGFEDKSKIELLNYKYEKIISFLDGGYILSTPCDKYCDYLKENEDSSGGNPYLEPVFGNTEETKACYEKYYLSANSLFHKAQTAIIAYMNKESITKKEYDNIIEEVEIKNNKIIEEVNAIKNLESIPSEKVCTDDFCKNCKKESNL